MLSTLSTLIISLKLVFTYKTQNSRHKHLKPRKTRLPQLFPPQITPRISYYLGLPRVSPRAVKKVCGANRNALNFGRSRIKPRGGGGGSRGKLATIGAYGERLLSGFVGSMVRPSAYILARPFLPPPALLLARAFCSPLRRSAFIWRKSNFSMGRGSPRAGLRRFFQGIVWAAVFGGCALKLRNAMPAPIP